MPLDSKKNVSNCHIVFNLLYDSGYWTIFIADEDEICNNKYRVLLKNVPRNKQNFAELRFHIETLVAVDAGQILLTEEEEICNNKDGVLLKNSIEN